MGNRSTYDNMSSKQHRSFWEMAGTAAVREMQADAVPMDSQLIFGGKQRD